MPKPAEIDLTSPDLVLTYVGGRTPRNVPARDLSVNDVGRIAYRQALQETNRTRSHLIPPGGSRQPVLRPAQPDTTAVAAVLDELIASGVFVKYEPPPEPVEPVQPVDVVSIQPAPDLPQPSPELEPPVMDSPPPAAPVDHGGPA